MAGRIGFVYTGLMRSHPSGSRSSARHRLILLGVGGVLVAGVLGVLIHAILTGRTREFSAGDTATSTVPDVAGPSTSTVELVPRRLDGVPVAPSAAALRPWGFMVDIQSDARPAEGLADASVVIEAPVEGGITRLLALFDPMTTTTRIGAVRSARPYFVDWAGAWRAVFAHVGGSPEALDRLARTPSSTVHDVNEMTRAANAFRRDPARVAPHQVFTTPERFGGFLGAVATSTVAFSPWRYTDDAIPTSTVAAVAPRIPYGGSYTVRWAYEPDRNAYRRIQSGRALSSQPIYATNVVVIKTDSEVLDDAGRLRVRTTGGGEAVVYRDGKKLVGRWRRATGDAMAFTGTDGVDLNLRAGNTWIEVTTDDRVFAGLDL